MGEGLQGMHIIYVNVLDEVIFIVSKIASSVGKRCRTVGSTFAKYGYVDTLFQNTPMWADKEAKK